MGTQIQSDTYLSRHYSRDLNVNVSTGRWFSYQQEKALKDNQYYDSSTAWQGLMSGFFGHDKAKLRETILKQESTFRHQVQELHRLYGRQRDLMNDIQKELHRPEEAKTSHSVFFPSYISSEGAKRTWNNSHLPSSDSMICLGIHPPGSRDKGSPTSVMKGKSSLYSNFCSETGHLEKCGCFYSCNNMILGKPIDLENSGGEPMINEETIERGRYSGLAGNGVGCEGKNEALQDRSFSSSLDSVLKYQNSSGDLGTNIRSRGTNHLGNLNEPIQLLGPSFLKTSRNVYGLAEKVERQNRHADSNSTFPSLHKDNSQFSIPVMDDRSLISGSDRNGKEQMDCGFKTDIESFQVESRLENQRKRKIFGVEIAEVDEPTLNGLETGSSSFLSGRAIASHLDKKVTSSQGNHNATTSEGSFWKLDICSQNPEFNRETVLELCDARKTSVPESEGSQPNGVYVYPHLNSKMVDNGSSSGFDIWNGRTAVTSVPGLSAFHDPTRLRKGVHSSDVKAWKNLKLDPVSTNTYPDVMHDSVAASSHSKSLSFSTIPSQYNCGKMWGQEISYGMDLDCLQKCSNYFFKKSETAQISSQILNLSKESNLETSTKDTENKEVGRVDTNNVLGFPVPEVINKISTVNSTSSVSEARCSDGNKFPSQLEASPNILEKGLNNYISGLQLHIDLNLTITEEEEDPASAAFPSAVVEIAMPEIDLEIPVVIETEAVNGGTKLSIDNAEEPPQELIEMAAEAIVAISSALVDDVADNAICLPFEVTPVDCLQWFAELICSCASDKESKTRETPCVIDGGCDEEIIPDGMDYFEFMTLKLKDIKEESYSNNLPDMEYQKDEETAVTATRRSRRGQGRRGRQRVDFQRDTLPNLVSLSKQEVVEDLQTLEELFQSTGRTWRSSLSRRNGAKNGRRGKNSASSLVAAISNSTCPPSGQQQTCRQLQLTDKSLTGWGKRTRRFPRQRCMKNTCSAIKLLTSA